MVKLHLDDENCLVHVLCSITERQSRKPLHTEEMLCITNGFGVFKTPLGYADIDGMSFQIEFVRQCRMIPQLRPGCEIYSPDHQALVKKVNELGRDWYCESIVLDVFAQVPARDIEAYVRRNRPKNTFFTKTGVVVFNDHRHYVHRDV